MKDFLGNIFFFMIRLKLIGNRKIVRHLHKHQKQLMHQLHKLLLLPKIVLRLLKKRVGIYFLSSLQIRDTEYPAKKYSAQL